MRDFADECRKSRTSDCVFNDALQTSIASSSGTEAAETTKRLVGTCRMKNWVIRHPLSSFFCVAYAVSWSIAVPLALQAQGVLPERLPWSLHYLTAFGPAVAAFLIARLLQEPPEGDDRAQSPSGARSSLWWTVGFGSPLLLWLIAQGAARIVGQRDRTGRRSGMSIFCRIWV